MARNPSTIQKFPLEFIQAEFGKDFFINSNNFQATVEEPSSVILEQLSSLQKIYFLRANLPNKNIPEILEFLQKWHLEDPFITKVMEGLSRLVDYTFCAKYFFTTKNVIELLKEVYPFSYSKTEILAVFSFFFKNKIMLTADPDSMSMLYRSIEHFPFDSLSFTYLFPYLHLDLTLSLDKIRLDPIGAAEEVHFLINQKSIDTSRDLAQSKIAFEAPFIDVNACLDHFEDFVFTKIIQENYKNPKKYYSLMFPIVQSSGYGKSRLVIEAGKERLNIVYGCLRPSSSSGYPRGNKKLTDFLEKNNNLESLKRFIVTIFYLAYSVIIQADPTRPLSWFFDDFERIELFWNEVLNLYQEAFEKDFAGLGGRILTFFKLSQEQYRNKPCIKRKERVIYDSQDAFPIASELLIVLDEASAVLFSGSLDLKGRNLYRNLKLAMREIQSANCVLVLIDTVFPVVDLAPASVFDNSFRPVPGYELLPPFYEVLTYNSFGRMDHIGHSTDHAKEMAQILSKGRPLWYVYFFSGYINRQVLDEAIFFARQKLLCHQSGVFLSSPFNEAGATAVVALRFGIYGVHDYRLASELTASHMGTLMNIDEERLRLSGRYPAEPILAEAACQVLHEEDRMKGVAQRFSLQPRRVFLLLSNFASQWMSGLVSAGESGEIMARILLALSYDSAHFGRSALSCTPPASRRSSDPDEGSQAIPVPPASGPATDDPSRSPPMLFSDPITVLEFLKSIVSDHYLQQFECIFGRPLYNHNSPIMEGEIAFTSYSHCPILKAEEITPEFLEECFNSRTAVIPKINQAGCDVIFPVRLDIERRVYTHLLVQFKKGHMKMADRLEAAGKKLTPMYCFGRYRSRGSRAGPILLRSASLSMYMELSMEPARTLGFTSGPTETLEEDSYRIRRQMKIRGLLEKYPNHVLLFGASYKAMDNPMVRDALNLFDLNCVDQLDSSKHPKALASMEPIAFRSLFK